MHYRVKPLTHFQGASSAKPTDSVSIALSAHRSPPFSNLWWCSALHGWIAWLSAAYLLVVNPPENLTLDFESHSPQSSALFKFVTGFYFWLSVNSITQRFRTRDHWLTTAHHIAVAYVYGFCLFPEGYLHKYDLLYNTIQRYLAAYTII